MNGRRLASAVNSSTGINNSYTYDADGLRLTKTVNGVQHKYVWQGSQLVSEYYGGTELEFFYDESGVPYAFSYKANASATPVMYYYVTNLQGDVTNIVDASGNVNSTYSYNAWGKLIFSAGTMSAINPIRYRGYYYDSETGLYYLQSRYYDPEICRFINADGLIDLTNGTTGANLFAYCHNSPIVNIDPSGEISWSKIRNFGINCIKFAIISAGVGFSILAVAAAITGTISTGGAGAIAIPVAIKVATDALISATSAVATLGLISYATGSSGQERKTSNPNGRKGSQDHQDEVAKQTANFDRSKVKYEVKIDTPNGSKSCRFADFSVTENGSTWYGQVGKILKSGIPVARERKAIADITQALGDVVIRFFPYN